jgi:hypothetical protein
MHKMAKAGTKGILLGDYIKLYEQPELLVRAQLDSGELRYVWKDAKGKERASDDGGPQPPKTWWLMLEFTKIDRETHEVWGNPQIRPTFPPMFFVRVFPAIAPKTKARGRPADKFDLVLDILGDIDRRSGLASNLQPAEIERKVLPEFRRRWAELKPDDKTEPPVSRRVINRAYQKFLGDRSSK